MNFFTWSAIVIALSLVVYGFFSFFRIQELIKESSVLVRSSVPYQHTVSSDASEVLFIGDSTGVGVGATRPEDSLAGRLSRDYPKWNISNISESGKKTAEIIPLFHSISDHSFRLVIVQIGGNDIIRFSDEEKLAKDIATVLSEAKRVGDRIILITSGNVANAPFFPRPLAFLWGDKSLRVRAIFMEATQKNDATYIDLFLPKKDDPFALEPYRYHSRDLLHPSSEGYGLWYESLKKALEN